MKTQNVSAQSFNGGLFVVNKLSKKPAQCIEKEKSNIIALIKKENFDLFLKQDYSGNKVNIIATTKTNPSLYASNSVSIEANHSHYMKTAQKTVAEYKNISDEIYRKSLTEKLTFKEKLYKKLFYLIVSLTRV